MGPQTGPGSPAPGDAAFRGGPSPGPDPEWSRQSAAAPVLAVAAGALSVAIGGVVLLGWILDLPLLRSAFAGQVSAKPNAAVALVAAGVALALLGSSRSGALRRTAAAAGGALAALVGAATSVQYLAGVDLGIDQALFREAAGAPWTSHPGRMASLAAASFLAVGLALAAYRWRRARRPVDASGLAVSALALTVLVSYTYGAEALSGFPGHTRVALPTAAGLLTLGVGLLFLPPAGGLAFLLLSPGPAGRMVRRLLPAAIAIPFVVGLVAVRVGSQTSWELPYDMAIVVVTVIFLNLTVVWWTAVEIGREVARRTEVERAYREEAEIVKSLHRIGELLTAELDERRLIQAITDVTTWESGARFGAFYGRRDGDDDAYVLVAFSGSFADPDHASLCRAAVGREDTLRIADVTRDPVVGAVVGASGGGRARSVLATPVSAPRTGRVLGGLVFGHPEPGAFTARHERLVTGVASWAGLAVENARLFQDVRQAVRDREEIMAVVSHDLRDSLQSVVGASRLLEVLPPERLATEGGRYVAMVNRATAHMEGLIRDLLDVQMIQTGRFAVEPEAVRLDELVEDAVLAVSARADEKGTGIAVEVPDPGAEVQADRKRVVQVLCNLLNNAVKFGPPGGRIHVQAEVRDDEAVLSVADEGPGIPEPDLERVFERFWKGGARPNGPPGSGLGLAIARGIVEAHGGRIWAERRAGAGATFHVCIPAAPDRSPSVEGADAHRGLDRGGLRREAPPA